MTTTANEKAPLKLGFIGGGNNSAIGSAHFAASMLDNRFQVSSGCFSRDEEINRQTAERWNIDPSKCCTNWRNYLENAVSEVDAICILTPIPDHYDMLVRSLDLGIPVICEKALVSDSVQATALLERYSDIPYFLAVTLNYSGYPIVRLLKELIAQGQFGTLQQIHLEMPLENYTRIPYAQENPSKPQVWRQTDSTVPTILLDLGVHLHHLLHFTTGANAQRVMAKFNHFSTMPDIIDDARLWIECDTGLEASMWMSKTALGNRNGMRLRLFGDQGSAEWYQFEPEVLHVTDVHGVRSQFDRGVENDILHTAHYNRFKAGHPSGYVEAFGNLYWDMADSLHTYRKSGLFEHPYVFSLEHARDGLAMLESACESNRQGRWIDVASSTYVHHGTTSITEINRHVDGGHVGLRHAKVKLETDRAA